MIANKLLGQSKPAATTPTDLYTVPASTQANLNLFVANQEQAGDTIRVSLALAGLALESKQYIVYDVSIAANSVYKITGISLAATDKLRVYSTNGTCSFTATGVEITA
jgi:hypothetical protein